MAIDPKLIQAMAEKKDTSIIPHGDDCFKLVPIQPGETMLNDPDEYGKTLREYTYRGDIKQVLCPYWHRTDYGMVQCRFLEIEGFLEEDDDARTKAIRHFGSEEKFQQANVAVMLYAEMKCCQINVLD